MDHLTLLNIRLHIPHGWNTFYKIFQKNFTKFFTKILFLKFFQFFLIFSAKVGILMLISEWHIFFEFLQFNWSKFFLSVVCEYAKNQKNSGHSVVSSISAKYGKVAAKFSKNNLSLVYHPSPQKISHANLMKKFATQVWWVVYIRAPLSSKHHLS